jgi:hypothetical protein
VSRGGWLPLTAKGVIERSILRWLDVELYMYRESQSNRRRPYIKNEAGTDAVW